MKSAPNAPIAAALINWLVIAIRRGFGEGRQRSSMLAGTAGYFDGCNVH